MTEVDREADFYPASAAVPAEKRTDRVLLQPLRAAHVELDYDAVMSSAAELRRWSQTDWPADDFTLAENLADLVRHEREHGERVAFTYTVLTPDAARCLGCVYIKPLPPEARGLFAGAKRPADVGFWVRASEVAHDLDRHLLATLREWFASEWAFDRVVFGIAAGESRQAALLAAADLVDLGPVTLADGRACRVFGTMEPHSNRRA